MATTTEWANDVGLDAIVALLLENRMFSDGLPDGILQLASFE